MKPKEFIQMKLQVILYPEGARAYRAMLISRAAHPLYLSRVIYNMRNRPDAFNAGPSIANKTSNQELANAITANERRVEAIRNLPTEFFLTIEKDLNGVVVRSKQSAARALGFKPSKHYLIESFSIIS